MYYEITLILIAVIFGIRFKNIYQKG